MATPGAATLAHLREANTTFMGMFSKRMELGVYAGLFREVPTTAANIAKIAGLYPVGEMEDAVGTATVDGLKAASYLIETKGRRYTGGIDHEIMMAGNDAFSGELLRAINLSANIVACDIEKRFTTLLEANGNDIFGSAFFADAKTIPGTSITIDNLRSGAWTDSLSEVRAGVFEGVEAFDEMRDSMNCPIHNTSEGPRFVLMYHPSVREFVMDAVNYERNAGGTVSRLDDMGVVARANPLLTDTDDLYLFSMDPNYQPFVLAKRGEPEFRTTTGASDEFHLIMTNEHLWQPYYAAEVGYGSAFSAVKLVDA